MILPVSESNDATPISGTNSTIRPGARSLPWGNKADAGHRPDTAIKATLDGSGGVFSKIRMLGVTGTEDYCSSRSLLSRISSTHSGQRADPPEVGPD
jgi:hypothetical protein